VAGGVGTNSLAYSSDGIAWTGLGEISTGPSTTLTNVHLSRGMEYAGQLLQVIRPMQQVSMVLIGMVKVE
jgi:hypothetical protein